MTSKYKIGAIANAKYQLNLKLGYIKKANIQINALKEELVRLESEVAKYKEFLKKADKNETL